MNETTKETYIISFMNMKGGVGKTTLCVNLADAISRKFDKSVLLIDFDPQANSTQYILKPEIYREIYDSEKTVYRIYKALIEDNNRISLVDGNANDDYEECDEEDENIEDIIYKVSEKFHLIPGDLNMVKIGKIADGTGTTKSCPGTNFFGGNTVEEANKYFIPLIKQELERIDKAAQTKKGQVLANILNIREGAGTQYKAIGTYKKGDIIEILEEKGNWAKTSKGWVCSDFIKIIN